MDEKEYLYLYLFIFNVVDSGCWVLYLVRDVLLLCRGVTFGVDEGRVCYQVTSVLHYETPATYTHTYVRVQTVTLQS